MTGPRFFFTHSRVPVVTFLNMATPPQLRHSPPVTTSNTESHLSVPLIQALNSSVFSPSGFYTPVPSPLFYTTFPLFPSDQFLIP